MNGDRALAIVREAGGDELVERLAHLDAVRSFGVVAPDVPVPEPGRDDAVDTDVVFAGGGLSLLIAAALAARGVRVTVLDRARVGAAHREWNASGPELRSLVRGGIVTEDELARLVIARYEKGICAFHGSPPTVVTGVLDHAVDAGPLLTHARALAVARGAVMLDEHSVVGMRAGASAVSVCGRSGAGSLLTLRARVAVDARGASSPYASADLVCPTVGGVVRGLNEGEATDEIDPQTGEILVTNEPAREGRQHIWEAFPGRPGETTIYQFYYARTDRAGSLLALFARFLESLPRYKRGEARLVRPTFGFIPAWSRLVDPPRSPSPRIVLVGDAAARHSPLTMCGFGAMLRSFDGVARTIAEAVEAGAAPASDGGALALDAPLHTLTGGLALLMATPARDPDALNGLLGDAFASLAGLGNDAYSALLRDESSLVDVMRFLRGVAGRRPSVYRDVFRALPVATLSRWGWRVARELAHAR